MTAPALRWFRRHPELILHGADSWTVLLADRLDEFAASPHLVRLLALDGAWTLDQARAAGLPLTESALDQLLDAGMVVTAASDNGTADPPIDPLVLAVLRRSSLGLPADQLPAVAAAAAAGDPGEPVELPAGLPLNASLETVLATRRTVRQFADEPLTLVEISTILQHSARLRRDIQPPSRAFPSAGAKGELDIYLLPRDVAGLPSPVYRYLAAEHRLAPVVTVGPRPDHERTLRNATGNKLTGLPGVQLIVTADLPPLLSRYGPRAGNLAQADFGCLTQTLYLVATALGLAPCVIGGARQQEDCRWLDLNPRTAFPLGYFLIGKQFSQHTSGES